MCKCLLIERAWSLDNLSEGVEYLASDSDRFEKVSFAGIVDQLLAGVVPVEVHDGLLQSQQVIDCADDHVYCRSVACLCTKIVLPL